MGRLVLYLPIPLPLPSSLLPPTPFRENAGEHPTPILESLISLNESYVAKRKLMRFS